MVLDNRTGAYINQWDYFPNKKDRKGCKKWKMLITYGRQIKATLEYTGLQLTPTEMQKSDD